MNLVYGFGPTQLAHYLHAIKISGLTIPEAVAFSFAQSPSKAAVVALLDAPETASQVHKFQLADAALLDALHMFAESPPSYFDDVFATTWTKLMTADLHDGPTSTPCTGDVCLCPAPMDPKRKMLFSPKPPPAMIPCQC